MGTLRLVFSAWLVVVSVYVEAKPFEMDLLETPDMRLLYLDPVQTYLVPHMSRSFQNSLSFQETIFDWKPWDKTTVVLTDLSDYGNAGASVSPGNGVTVYIAPSNRTLETLPGNERTFMLMNHELVHIATMDAWNDQDSRWRRFFMGKPRPSDQHPESILYNYLAVPRMSSPRWYQEGAAVFLETWMSGGVGRAQGAYDEMVFRSMVRDDAWFYSNLGIVSEGVGVDFQVGVNAYLYGTRFISYLAHEYSPEQVISWLKRNEGSERYYARQFTHVFGLKLEQAWDDWIGFEKDFQQRNLARVRQTPLTPVRHVVDQPLGSISRAFLTSDQRYLVGAFRYPGVVAHVGIVDLETGRIEKVTDIKGPKIFPVTSPAYDPGSNKLFYTADNNAYRDLMSVDLVTHEKELLIKDARIGDIAFNRADRSIWGLRHLNGYVSLVRIPYPYSDWNEIHTWPYGQILYELDVSTDGRLLSASRADISGNQQLLVFSTDGLLEGDLEPVLEQDFGTSVPEGFVFSPDSRYLFGSSFYTGVSNIFRIQLENGDREAVSNAETGFFRPIPMTDGRLVVFEYTGKGFVPSIMDPVPLDEVSSILFLGNETVRKHPSLKDWSVVKTLSTTTYEEGVTEGKYRPYRQLSLKSGYPVIEGYRDDVALGWHFDFADPAGFNRLELTASYTLDTGSPSDERFHFNAEYSMLNWRVRYWHNDADFYDLFGPTENSRKGDAFVVGYDRALIYDTPRELKLSAQAAYYTGLDTLPSNQNVPSLLFRDLFSATASLNFENTRKSLGAVDHEKGYRWDIALNVDRAAGQTISKLRAGFDFGVALPWKHSSLWLYSSAGAAHGERSNPLTSYYFGSYGNNYVDDGETKRYRRYYSLPGFEIDELSAKRFAKTVLEWNLPPVRFREVGSPGLFLSWLRPALFAGTLWTDPNEIFDRRLTTVGGQVDFRFTLAHRLPMTLSIGYAVGYINSRRDDQEWMISLKVL